MSHSGMQSASKEAHHELSEAEHNEASAENAASSSSSNVQAAQQASSAAKRKLGQLNMAVRICCIGNHEVCAS